MKEVKHVMIDLLLPRANPPLKYKCNTMYRKGILLSMFGCIF